jgi:hypothetical protein
MNPGAITIVFFRIALLGSVKSVSNVRVANWLMAVSILSQSSKQILKPTVFPLTSIR